MSRDRGGSPSEQQGNSALVSSDNATGYWVIFETGTAGMLVATADGRVIQANAEAGRLIGKEREEILLGYIDAIFDTSESRFASATRTLRTTGGFKGRLSLACEGGAVTEVEASLTTFFSEDGEERLGVVFREAVEGTARLKDAIAQLERSRRQLRTSEELFRITFEHAGVGMAHVAVDGRWLRVNDKLLHIVGYPRDELLGLTFQDITHPADLEKDLEHVRRMLQGQIDSYQIEKRYLRRDGGIVWIKLVVSLVRGPSREPECFVSVIEDVTERKVKELIPDPLTPREVEILSLIALKRTNDEIAKSLAYSISTIKLHVQRIIAKLGVSSRIEAADKATEIGLLPPTR